MDSKVTVLDGAPKEIQNVGNTPADMIRMAVAGGADLEKLEKLLCLQERWEANEAKKAYNQAIAEFKKNPPEIDKDKTVQYKEVKYNHASLFNVVEKITAELSKHGLSVAWTTHQNGQVVVTCRITHVQGHSEETTLSAPADSSGSKNSIQAIGSTVTYLQRYTLLSALGLATKDQDDDGRGATVKISEEQLGTLRDLLIEMGDEDKESKLAKGLGVDRMEDLPAADFKRALAALEARKAAKGASK